MPVNSTRDKVAVALTHAVRLLSVEQLAAGWLGGDESEAWALVEVLRRDGFIEVESHLVHGSVRVEVPQATWRPGEEPPRLGPVAYRLRKRWSAARELVDLVFPQPSACARYGGCAVRPRVSELSHDLLMSWTYLNVQSWSNGLDWMSGDRYRANGLATPLVGLVPDALLMRPDGSVDRAIEGAGAYGRSKLQRLHSAYARAGVAYELW